MKASVIKEKAKAELDQSWISEVLNSKCWLSLVMSTLNILEIHTNKQAFSKVV